MDVQIKRDYYKQQPRLFKDLNREHKQLKKRLKDEGTPFPAMIYPQVMKSKLITFKPSIYSVDYFENETVAMEHDTDGKNPPVPNPCPKPSKAKLTLKTKAKINTLKQPTLKLKPISGVSQKALVAKKSEQKKRRMILRDESEGEKELNPLEKTMVEELYISTTREARA